MSVVSEIQIQDSAKNTAVVKLQRAGSWELHKWASLTPGAFAPEIPIDNLWYGFAQRVNDPVHFAMLSCDIVYSTGETVGCFALWNFFWGFLGTGYTFGEGDGMLFPRGVQGGKLQPGRMTWTIL